VGNIPNLLKALVITGGVALVAGSALLVALVLTRGHRERQVVQGAPVTIGLPKGARVEQVTADGSRWLLLGTAGDGRQFLAVVDPRTGKPASLMWLQPED
jgi:Family of unknown function (DUF6476)